MRRLIFLLLVFIFGACTGPKYPDPKDDKEFDEWSGIEASQLNNDMPEDLQLLGMVWGFLKYYHPAVAEGRYNWDYELFRILPLYLEASTNKERDQVLLDWMIGMGSFNVRKSALSIAQNTIKLSPDLDWITNWGLSPALVSKLTEVKNAKRKNKHYYIALAPNVGNPVIKNENAYASKIYPDPGFRLLALYRYWNIIQYYFPYKNLIEKDWKEVLKESLPEFIAARNEIEYKLAILKLMGKIHDGHAQMMGQESNLHRYFGPYYAPVKLSFVDDKAMVTGFLNEKSRQESGLQLGDVIRTVNHKTIDSVLAARLPYTPASNEAAQLRYASRNILRTTDRSIDVEYERDQQVYSIQLQTMTLSQYSMNAKFDTCFKMLTPQIAYVNNGTLKRKHIAQLMPHIAPTKGLIIDIRNYPSDFPIYELSKYLIPNSTAFVKFTNGSIVEPGLFTFTETLRAGRKNSDYYKGKVLILVNEVTQSSAEFHAMAYRCAPKAIVLGSTTAGADGNISPFTLPGGVNTMISGIGVYYPDGTETQRVGIIPDIVVRPTLEGIKANRDEILEKAISLIEE